MLGSASPKKKARGQAKSTKPSKNEAGDTRDSRTLLKSNDPQNLEEYLQRLLPDTSQKGKKRKDSQRPSTQDIGRQIKCDISSFLKDLIIFCTDDLPDKEKLEYLLNAVQSRGVLAFDFNDSLVDEASNKLPSLAYQLLAPCLIQEARQTLQKSTPSVSSTFGTGLLSHFCHWQDEWKVFLDVCKPEELPSIFKHLISIGVQEFISKATDDPKQVYFHPALEIILVSEHSVAGLALLLKDEVERGKDQADFFTSSQLGSLLSLNTGTLTNKNMRFNSLEGFLIDVLCDKRRNRPMSDIIDTVRDHVTKMTCVVTTAVTNLLQSSIEFHRQSVLAWIASVINSIRHSQCREPQDCRTRDVCSITFSVVLLKSWKCLREKQPIDFRYYSSDACILNLDGVVSLTGDKIKVVNRNSGSSLTRAQAADKLFFCCQRAVGVCLLPALRRELGIPNSEELPELARSYLQIHLINMTLFHECLHQMVAYVYNDQCKFLLQMLCRDESKKSINAKSLRNASHSSTVSLIPRFFFDDMSNWIAYIIEKKSYLSDKLQSIPLENCLELCIHLLKWRHFQVISHIVQSTSIAILRVCADLEEQKKCIPTKMVAEINQVLPSLLRFYARDHGGVIADRSLLSDTRAYIVRQLDTCWPKPQFGTALHEQKEELVMDFLISFLDEMRILISACVSSVLSSREEAAKENVIEMSWLYDHFNTLRKLTSDSVIIPKLWAPPLHSHTDHTLSCSTEAISRLPLVGDCYKSMKPSHKFKFLLGLIVQNLLCSGKGSGGTQAASWDLSKRFSQLKVMEEDPMFTYMDFNDLMAAIKGATTSHSENQEPVLAEDESWMTECLNTPLDEDALLEGFHAHLRHARLRSASLLQSHALETHFKNATPVSQTMEFLKVEMQCWKRTFPSSPSAAVFLVVDKERMDVMRCAMSGPVGTPYSRGLFVFDIFCPADYPSVPPRVRLVPTMDGTVFFRSHLENNDVSLTSLEKKFKYGNRGKWSVRKVLHLLESMMLTDVKEVTQDGAKCTEGRSRRLCQVRAQTVRHAMLEPLENPPVGLEKVVGLYFAVQQEALLKQCARWAKDCVEEKKTKVHVLSLYRVLQNLDVFAQ